MQHPISPGAWRAYKRRQTSVTLITLDQATTRVHIVWGQDAEAGGIGRLTTPTNADLAALDLPGWARPAYWAIRPVRLVPIGWPAGVQAATSGPIWAHQQPWSRRFFELAKSMPMTCWSILDAATPEF